MFKKIISVYPHNSTHQSQQQFIKQVILNNKQLSGLQLIKELKQQYDSVISILRSHPKIIIEFAFQYMVIQDCLRLMQIKQDEEFLKEENGLIRLLNDLGVGLDRDKNKLDIQWFSNMYTKYSSIQKILIFLRELSINYQNKISDAFLPQFLASFIKASALAIESFLKLKSQSPMFDIDYIEHGQKLVKNTQEWVKIFYKNLIVNLRVPKKDNNLRYSILNGIGDMVGALLQVQRQGNISFGICQQLLDCCYNYLRRLTNLQQLNNLYVDKLVKSNFNIPHHKIILPEFYPWNIVTIPKQSFGFIAWRFISQSTWLYSHQFVVNQLILILNELIMFQYQFKKQSIKLFLKLIQQNDVKFTTLSQSRLPLSVFWFNLSHYHQKANQSLLSQINVIYRSISLSDPKTYLNSLNILNYFRPQNLQSQINQFIAQKSLLISKQNPEMLILLIKNTHWNNVNDKGQKAWSQLVKNMLQKAQLKNQLQKIIKSRKNKSEFEKSLIEKIILS